MAHLWSGRFEGDPDAGLFAFGASFRFDRRLFEDDVRGSLAWAAGLQRAGVIWQDEDVHAFVERELSARVGDAGRRLHTGRSRNEQVAVDLRLYLKRRIPELQRGLRALIAGLADRAVDAADALMPSYTHLRRAQPVLAAHYFLAHATALRRDHDRFDGVLAEV